MKKYLLKRLLFSLFALVVVTGTVMTLVYTLMHRETVVMNDDAYKKAKGGEKKAYAYSKYYEYGYIYYETFETWLNSKIEDHDSADYKEAIAAVQKTGTADDVVYPENAYCQEYASYYQSQGYLVEWEKPLVNRRGEVTASGYLMATRDKNVFERLGNYFGNFFSFDTIWSVSDDVGERYLRWEWDPYSNMPALVGNGTKHRYLIYFDNKFPFIHQNFLSLNMGKSKMYEGEDTSNLITARTGRSELETTILPKDLYTENPPLAESDLDFHTVTYSSYLSTAHTKVYGEGNHYVNATLKKDGLTRMGNSFVLGIIATIASYMIGLPIGIWMARKKDKLPDKIGNLYIIFIIAVPSLAYIYMFAAIGINLFGLPYKWQLAPVKALAAILPIISLALPAIGGLMRWTRRYMVDQENADYVKFARSQGFTESEIFRKHIFRNALIYIVHGIPIDILTCLTGAIITERVYGVPGIGGLLTDAISAKDNGVIIGATVFYTALSIIALLLGDLLLAKYDPRVSFTNERG